MSNALVRGGSYYNAPAVQYQPARPAYTWYESVTGVQIGNYFHVTSSQLLNGSVRGEQGTVLIFTGGPNGNNNTVGSSTYTIGHFVSAQVEVLGSPAQRIDVPPAGWTAFGYTVASMRRYGEATFKVMGSVNGAAVGLTANTEPTTGYGYMPHAMVFTGGKVYLASTGALLGTFTAADVFKIANSGGTVRYYKGATLLTSEAETFAPASRLMLSAALYRAGDFVSDPVVTEMLEGNAALTEPPMAMFAADYAAGSTQMVEPPMRLVAFVGDLTYLTEPAWAMYAGDIAGYAQALLVEPRMVLAASGLGDTVIVVPDPFAEMAEPAMALVALMLSGNIGSPSMTEPRMRMLAADYQYGEGVMTEPAMRMVAFEEPDYMGFWAQLLEARFDLVARVEDTVVMPWPLLVGFDLSAEVAGLAEMPWPAVLGFELRATTEDTVVVPWRVLFDFPLAAPADDVDVWAVNLATNGSTSYAGFVFNSFANIGGRYFGSNAGGIFELDGDDDAGKPIDAAISLGKKDFGSAQKKTLVECFVTMAGQAPLYMKLSAEGHEFIYQTQSYSDELQLQRFKFGKGKALQANYLTPIIYNVDGEDFELEGIQFAVADLQRKL